MRILLTFIAVFTTLTSLSQIQKLKELTTNKFIDSKIIYEETGGDVFGYFLIFKNDVIEKNLIEFEYFLLDKNLNKLSTGRFIQSQFSAFYSSIGTTSFSLSYVKKKKDMLYFSLFESNIFEHYNIFQNKNLGYRTLDLKDYTLSDQFLLKDYKLTKQEGGLSVSDYTKSYFYQITKNDGIIVDNMRLPSIGSADANKFLKRITEIRFFDYNFNPKWTYKINQNKKEKSFDLYKYITGDKEDMVFIKEHFENIKDKSPKISYEIINSDNGTKKYEINFKDDDNIIQIKKFIFDDDKIFLYAEIYDLNKNGSLYKNILGYVKVAIDRQTGKELNRHFFYWDALAGKLDIDSFGEIKNYGYIHFLEYKRTSDNKTLVIGEGFNYGNDVQFLGNKRIMGGSEILDLFIFEFDDKMNLLYFQKIDKINNKVGLNGWGKRLEKYGAFDYAYAQNLPEKDSFVFFYTDNEKTGNKKLSDPKWVLGMVFYVDGKFTTDKMSLKTEEGNIVPIRAKIGYIILQEKIGDDYEIRLEKIQY